MYRELNPYKASLQSSIKRTIDTIKEKVYAYKAMGPGDLGYGYSEDVEYIFITDANDIEKGIPRFTLPIIDLEARRPTVIMDIRPFSKSKLIGIEDKLEDMLLTRSNYTLIIETALMFGSSIQGVILFKSEWYKTFSFLATNMLTSELSLDPYDRTALHVAILTYMVDTVEVDRDILSKNIIILNNILLNGMKLEIDDIVDITKNFDRDNKGLDVLMFNINKSSEDRRLKGLTLDIVIGAVSKLVISRDRGYISNSFEFPELFIPLLNTYMANSFLKKTKLVEGMKYIGRKIDSTLIEKELKNLIS